MCETGLGTMLKQCSDASIKCGRATAFRDVLDLLEREKHERPGFDWMSDIDAIKAKVQAMMDEKQTVTEMIDAEKMAWAELRKAELAYYKDDRLRGQWKMARDAWDKANAAIKAKVQAKIDEETGK